MNERAYKNHLLEQATAYFVTGILLSISHHFHNYAAVIFLGHLLIAASFVILISIALNYKWMRRIAGPLDIFNGTTLIITFAIDIVIFIVDELGYYTQLKLLPQNLTDSLFITILIAIYLWVLLLCIPIIVPAFKPRLSFRIRLQSFVFIAALALFLANHFLKIFPLENMLLGILILMIGILIILQKDTLPKLKLVLIYFSHLFLVLVIAFVLGGVLSLFTKAVPTTWFWISSSFSVFAFIISVLLLDRWRRILFRIVHKFFMKFFSILVAIFNKGRIITKRGILILFTKVRVIIVAFVEMIQKVSGKVKTWVNRSRGNRK